MASTSFTHIYLRITIAMNWLKKPEKANELLAAGEAVLFNGLEIQLWCCNKDKLISDLYLYLFYLTC